VETKAEVEVIVVGHVEAEGEVARAGRMEAGAKVEGPRGPKGIKWHS
jgi:hypothetical protein